MKLKKKQRPMTMLEWLRSTGGTAAGVEIIEEFGGENVRKVADAECGEVAREMFERASEAYHAYLLAHIEFLLEKKA